MQAACFVKEKNGRTRGPESFNYQWYAGGLRSLGGGGKKFMQHTKIRAKRERGEGEGKGNGDGEEKGREG
jgi:hypothetical protein